MVDINITVSGRYTGTVKINAWLLNKRTNIAAGLREAGAIVANQTRLNLKGPSHTKARLLGRHGEGESIYLTKGKYKGWVNNPFPGVLTNTLNRRIFAIMDSDGLACRVGTNVKYARIHEFGGMAGRGHKTRIPARPYLAPAFHKVHKRVFEIFRTKVMKAIR